MKRFLIGLLGGGTAAVVTWCLSHSAMWTTVIGLSVAVVIWAAAVADAIGDFLSDLPDMLD